MKYKRGTLVWTPHVTRQKETPATPPPTTTTQRKQDGRHSERKRAKNMVKEGENVVCVCVWVRDVADGALTGSLSLFPIYNVIVFLPPCSLSHEGTIYLFIVCVCVVIWFMFSVKKIQLSLHFENTPTSPDCDKKQASL